MKSYLDIPNALSFTYNLSVFGMCTCFYNHFLYMDQFHCFSNRLSPLPHLGVSYFLGGCGGYTILNF